MQLRIGMNSPKQRNNMNKKLSQRRCKRKEKFLQKREALPTHETIKRNMYLGKINAKQIIKDADMNLKSNKPLKPF